MKSPEGILLVKFKRFSLIKFKRFEFLLQQGFPLH